MVKVYYGSLQTQSSTTSSVTQSRVVGFNQLISAFVQFGASNEDLLGEGYDAARTFANGVMVPYYKGCILYSEAVGDSANKLADDYSATCGAEDLDEEKLRSEIESATRGCMSLSASISGLQSKSKPAEGDAQRIASLQDQLALAESKLRETQDKLDKLLQFNKSSATACDPANTYAFYMNKAQTGISTSFSGGNFNMPSDLSWIEIVEQGWENREIALSDAYTKAVEKVYSGEELTETDLTAIERYSTEHPEFVDPTVLKHSKEIRTLKSEEMTTRLLINKVDNGQVLNENEIKSLQEYNHKYPNGELSGRIQDTLKDNERNAKKLKAEAAEIENIMKSLEIKIKNGENKDVAIKDIIDEHLKDFNEEVRENLLDEILSKVDTHYLANNPAVVKQLQKAGVTWELLKQLKAYALGVEAPPIGMGANFVSTTTEVVNTTMGPALQENSSTIVGGFGSSLLTSYFVAQDYQSQIDNGEDAEDAAIKTAAHFMIGLEGAKAGAIAGTYFAGPFGTVVGGVLGFFFGSAFSYVGGKAFDEVYDEYGAPVIENVKRGFIN